MQAKCPTHGQVEARAVKRGNTVESYYCQCGLEAFTIEDVEAPRTDAEVAQEATTEEE